MTVDTKVQATRPDEWRRSVACPECGSPIGVPCDPSEHLPRLGEILRGGLAYVGGGHDVMCEDAEGRGYYLSIKDRCGCIDRLGERSMASERLYRSPNRDPWTGEWVTL